MADEVESPNQTAAPASVQKTSQPPRKRSRRKNKNGKVQQSQAPNRTPIKDLPPDRQAEIAGKKEADKAQRQHVYRPQVPGIVQKIEIHSAEVNLLYIRHFEACNEYAVAIDHVASERLGKRAEFNRYLQEFSEMIAQLTGTLTKLYGDYEVQSNGGMTNNKLPIQIEAFVQTKRSNELLQLFKTADNIVRMVQFLNIYGNLEDGQAGKDIKAVTDAIIRCVRGLRKVKARCFEHIIAEEALQIANADNLTVQDLTIARNIASKRAGQKTPQKRKAEARIDPGAPVASPLPAPSDGAEPKARKKFVRRAKSDTATAVEDIGRDPGEPEATAAE